MQNTLYIVRGVSGAGKSAFAKKLSGSLGAYWFEADHYFVNDEGDYVFEPARLGDAHEMCKGCAEWAMRLGRENIVVSNTFTTEKEIKPYLDLAATFKYHVVCLVVENRSETVDVHGVPIETIKKMVNRFSIKLAADKQRRIFNDIDYDRTRSLS